MQRLDVRGQTSVITGAASGMGAEVARELDRRGARLALIDRNADGLAALAAELNGLGGAVTELDDGLRVEPAPLSGGPWRAYADHRMATTGAIVGLAVPGVVVDDIASTSKTLPQFTKLWEQMLA